MKITFCYLLTIIITLFACSNNKSNLISEQKARNIFQNISTINALSQVIKLTGSLGNNSAGKPYIPDTLQKVINNRMKCFSEKMLSECYTFTSHKYDSLKKSNPAVYSKIFNNNIMKEAEYSVSLAQLPKGFKPITENLNKEELNQYTIHLFSLTKVEKSKADNDQVLKMYKKTNESIHKLFESFKTDPDIFVALK